MLHLAESAAKLAWPNALRWRPFTAEGRVLPLNLFKFAPCARLRLPPVWSFIFSMIDVLPLLSRPTMRTFTCDGREAVGGSG